MGVIERKIREREERQRLILNNARELIMECGVETVTMLDIAKKSELSKATLYLYFKSKEAILEEIFKEAGSYFIEYVESRLSPADSGLEAIRTLWMSYMEVFGESNDIFIMFGIKNHIAPVFPFIIEKTTDNESRMHYRLYRLIVEVLERGIADGSLDRSIKPENAARTMLMIASSIIDNVTRLPGNQRNPKVILAEMQSAFEIILRGLASERCDRSLLVLPVK